MHRRYFMVDLAELKMAVKLDEPRDAHVLRSMFSVRI
jgi:hypothetical protein